MSDNPFANPEADRYFQEPPKPAPAPAPQIATSSPPTSTNQVLDDYNPFAGQPQQATPAAPTFVQSAPVVIPSNQPSKNGNAAVDTQELQRRQEELERKAAELMRKEQELKNMQMGGFRSPNWPPLPSFLPCKPCVYMDIESEIAVELQWLVRRIYHFWILKTPNFPPLPEFIKIKPCFYQDINVEIPVEFQRLIRYIFYYWMALCGVMLFDWVLALALLIAGDPNGGASFGICLVNFFVCIPLSYVCWFRPVYKAFRDDSSFNFFVFFIVFAVQFVIHVLHAVGIPGYVPGFVNGLENMNTTTARIGAGVVSIISGVFHGGIAAVDALILMKVHAIYRSSGASLQRAQAEFATGVMSNKNVQQAAASAASAAAQNAFQQPQSGNRF